MKTNFKQKKEELLCKLYDEGIEADCLSEESSHYRFEEWDFWLTKKQKFWNRYTKEKGTGILYMIQKIKSAREEDERRNEFIRSLS